MSNSYRALTRKYRPQSFDDIVSQEHVSNTLLNAVEQDRIAHAYMFCGPRGVGKTTMARVLARVINGIDDTVDGEALNQTLNIIEIDAASNNKVEDVHHLRESVRIPPQNGRYKIFIVDEVHMLSKAAFNALLKTLEEPPEHAIFIFATTEPHKVLPTILSRVQRFDFKRIAVDEIVTRLEKITRDEGITIDHESLHVIAKKADGALRDALGLLDQAIAFCGDDIQHHELLKALNVVGSDRLFEFMGFVTQRNSSGGLELIHTLLQEGYDIQEFLVGLVEHLRNLYVAKQSRKMDLIEASAETKSRYQKEAQALDATDIMRYLYLVSEHQIKIKEVSQPRISFELMFLKMVHLEPLDGLKKLIAKVQVGGVDVSDAVEAPQAVEEATETSDAVEVSKSIEEPEAPQETEEPETPQPAAEPEPAQESEPPSSTRKEKPSFLDRIDLGAPSLSDHQDHTKETTPSTEAEVLNEAVEAGGNEQVEAGRNEQVQPEEDAPQKETGNNDQKQLSFDTITADWEDFVQGLSGKIPKILELQVERVQPVDLVGDVLKLECDNPLSKQMLDQQSRELCLHLKDHIGYMLRLHIEVINEQATPKKEKNPYEFFKELIKKDPILKDIVDKLGAELEY
ncbi:MAG: DNA polymerase III subunit gamma/tau [Bacteroidota bacterium]